MQEIGNLRDSQGSQIKRQFNVFPLCLPSAFWAFGKAKKRKNIGTESDGRKNLGKVGVFLRKMFLAFAIKSDFSVVLQMKIPKKEVMVKYPIGIQTFENIIREGYLYIDKTSWVFQLVNEGKYYFLSRPRRFGKSLLLSTMESYFLGKKELFQGLAIGELEKDWMAYPVLRMDFNARDYVDLGSLVAEFNKHLEYWEKDYGDEFKDREPEERFQHVIDKAMEKTGKPVVILVDEYDKPLLQVADNAELQESYRRKLKSFYSVVKTMDSKIRFAFFTGVTKFSKVSIFSDLNNLKDISLNHAYAELCGITEKEIHEHLDEQVNQMAEANHLTKEDCYAKLKENYDGYHFSEESVGVYNPFSLLNALCDQRFRDYWFETGTPTILVETLKRTNYELENLTREEVSSDLLGSLDSIAANPLPLMYQSGYLTIKDYNPRFMTYRLGFPNGEVERGFSMFLFSHYVPIRQEKTAFFIMKFVEEIENGMPESFMQRLEALFADQNYQIAGDAELYFHNAVTVIFKLLGFYVNVERHTSDGRMDMVVQTKDYIYILEFKIDHSSEIALAQIEEKQYAKPFAKDSRRLYKIGINFSSKTRRIEDWCIG